jgi:hypothetical protein
MSPLQTNAVYNWPNALLELTDLRGCTLLNDEEVSLRSDDEIKIISRQS